MAGSNTKEVSLLEESIFFAKLTGQLKCIPLTGYYVYAITENGLVCYIGKGKGGRALSHLKGKGNTDIAKFIKTTNNNYDWIILKHFDEEYDSLNYEEKLIEECRQLKYKLYNRTNYILDQNVRGRFRLFKATLDLCDSYIFPDLLTFLPLKECIEIVFREIKTFCESIPDYRVPYHKGVKINKLSYRLIPESGLTRVVIF